MEVLRPLAGGILLGTFALGFVYGVPGIAAGIVALGAIGVLMNVVDHA